MLIVFENKKLGVLNKSSHETIHPLEKVIVNLNDQMIIQGKQKAHIRHTKYHILLSSQEKLNIDSVGTRLLFGRIYWTSL